MALRKKRWNSLSSTWSEGLQSSTAEVLRHMSSRTAWTRQSLSFHRKHNLYTCSEARMVQTTEGKISLETINLLPLIFFFLGSWWPSSQSIIPVSFFCPIIQSLSVSLSSVGQYKWSVPVVMTSLWAMKACLLSLCHTLMSCDSNIFARVFFTRRAVRRLTGLWAQHSDISFPICRRHYRHTCTYKLILSTIFSTIVNSLSIYWTLRTLLVAIAVQKYVNMWWSGCRTAGWPC